MSGSPRDLAVVDHWSASLARSQARRSRAQRGRSARRAGAAHAGSLTALLEHHGARQPRDLAEETPWQLSLGRSRARRRAAQLRFVPSGSRAKRVSLGALAALTVGPTASLASGQSTVGPAVDPEPVTTTEHTIVLSSGSEGRQVQLLQKALGDVKVDGDFGPETEAAVRSFQSDAGLAVDGVVGPLTGAALRTQSAGKAFIADVSSTLAGPATLGAGETRVSTTGTTTGTSETGATEAGTTEAGSTGTGSTGMGTTETGTTETGTLEADTTSAVGAATGTSGGVVDAAGGAEAKAEIEPAEAEAEAKSATAEKQAEEEHAQAATTDTVKQLQIALHVSVDGNFGPETEAAVRRLQARHGLTVDGVVGPSTWNVIGVQDAAELTPPASALPRTPAPQAAATTDVSLNTGDGGAQGAAATAPAATAPADAPAAPATGATAVEWLQKALKLPVDGEFGPETEAAVRRLQARHGLTVDGVVGPSTWSVIGVQGAETLTPPPSALTAPSTPGGASGATQGASGAPSDEAEAIVARVIAAADEIATRPYVWGGGHGSFESEGYDCSGSVSYALHGGGLLSSPEDSTGLESYGEPGPGRYITIYANAEHAYMVIDGKRFDTVALAETGSRWSDSPGDDGGDFIERHPAGL
jgi:peptidoglycan hydrolase-like protein with peptidoglycan-binding domain